MFSQDDLSVWESLKNTLKPIFCHRENQAVSFPKRLRVRPCPQTELLNVLDLHGLTVEMAYQTLKQFINLHIQQNSKMITIITGKGSKEKEGLIHKEIKGWLETPFFRERINQIRWQNGGGALEIMLKRKKKK